MISTEIFIGLIFIVGYLVIVFESILKINKTAAALIMATISWAALFALTPENLAENTQKLGYHVNSVSQIIFFLLGAMTLVEMIDSHQGFRIITDAINTRAKRKMLWLIGAITFFLSSLLDNLTTTIIMVSLLRKLVHDPVERRYLGASVVIAANAGGAWTPIGDVTTTMLWIGGQLSTTSVMKSLFFPSIVSTITALGFLSTKFRGKYDLLRSEHSHVYEPGAKVVFTTGMCAFIAVPIIKALTGLPPFMGMLTGLGVLWLITDLLHRNDENRSHLRVPHVLTKIDTSGVLFFLGILFAIHALETAGLLQNIAWFLEEYVHSRSLIALSIGLFSSIVDNVPLVAGTMGMYPIELYPQDSSLWQMIAYTAGTGGSILIIGSAAGVALMGMEKVDFLWYAKKISISALVGYFAGFIVYLLAQFLF